MKIGMLFPGYGSQFVGMVKELYDNSRIMQEYFEEASTCLGINFVKLCFASSDIELAKIGHAYPALFLASVSTAAMIKDLGLELHYVAGYGIGEYSALCSAGGLNFPDGLYLIKKLAHFYINIRQQLDVKSVVIDGLSARKLNQICKENSSDDCRAHIAIYEHNNHLVTGHPDAVDAVAECASDCCGGKIKESESPDGFHTPLLNDLSDQLKIYLTKVDFKDLQIPLITSTDCKEVCLAKKAQDAIMRQIIKPIYWNSVLKQFSDADVLIIPAPAKSLVAEVKAFYPDKIVVGIDNLADLDILKTLLEQRQVITPVPSEV